MEPPGTIQSLIEALAQICDDNNLKVTISTSLEGGILTGISTIIGGLMGGRSGLMAGGIVGSVLSSIILQDFKPVSKVLREMDPIQRNKLIEKIKQVFGNIGTFGITAISTAILARTDMRELALREVRNYISRDLGLTML